MNEATCMPEANACASPLNTHKRSMIVQLRRVEGQLRGIQGLTEQDAGCEAVAQQIAAARRALDRASYQIVACTMEAELAAAADMETAAASVHIARTLAKYG
jgi:DNA-binding FrmR family transcriptional regulator